ILSQTTNYHLVAHPLTGTEYTLRRRSMKPVKNLVFAALLVFSIALNTLAGDIDHPGIVSPPQDPPLMPTAYGPKPFTSTDSQQTMVETSDYLFIKALAALLSVY